MAADSFAEGWPWEGPELLFPNPQLQRKQWLNLNGLWDFAFDQQARLEQPESVKEWPLQIRIPYAPEAQLSGVGNTDFHLRCWYRKRFRFCRPSGKRVLLHFGAVDYVAHVWVNGKYVGSHEGGYTPFSFDVTHALLSEGDQVIVVRADDDPEDLAKPRGKQDWRREPHSIWYTRTSGIWQTVWIEIVPPIYVERLRLLPHLERWEIGLDAFVAGELRSGLSVRVRLRNGTQLLADDEYLVIANEVHRRIALSDPGVDDYRNELLWSPEKPTLLEVDIALYERGLLIDEVRSYTALRSVRVEGERFLLNGRPYYLRLLLDQGYWEESLTTAPSPDSHRMDIERVKAAGFNGVRKHQKIEDPLFLYHADRMGLLVWAEMPSCYRFTHESVERLTREWIDVIDRDVNHPCIVVWVPFNESWGVPDLAEIESHRSCVRAIYHLTKTMDPTRPVIGNDGWESTATDIIGIHDYDSDPHRMAHKYDIQRNVEEILRRRRPGGRLLVLEGYETGSQPLMLTEFGGIACIHDDGGNAWGYSLASSGRDLEERYARLLEVINRLELFAGFCYTQFTDTFQEKNGLFTMNREPKFSLARMREITFGGGNPHGELYFVPAPPPEFPDRGPHGHA